MQTADLALLQGLLLVVVWPCIVGFTAAGTFFTVRYQQQINQQLNTGFGSTICLSFINIISSQAVSYTTDFEQWHPNVRTNVSCPFCLPAAAPIAAFKCVSVLLSVPEAAATTPATPKDSFVLHALVLPSMRACCIGNCRLLCSTQLCFILFHFCMNVSF